MELSGSADSVLLEGFRLDRRGGCLFRVNQGGAATPVALGPRAVNLLSLLVERQGELVSKDAIMMAVWPGRVVEEANLNVQISKLRHILDRNREQGSCIQTVAGRGYCFVGAVNRPEPEAKVPAARPAAPPACALPRPRLSIVVLPFTNLGDDREQQYFADGIIDDLTADLSRIAGLFVISCNTAFTYRGKPLDTKQIGRDLRVRYVLEGSVRRAGHQLRVNAQLIDAETAAHLWAERFDLDAGDLFALQNQVTSRIAIALDLQLVGAEAARPAEHPDALDYIFRGRAAAWGKAPSLDSYAEAIELFERALALDPGSVVAQSWLASALANRALDFPSTESAGEIKRAEELATKALAVFPRSPLAHFAKGQALRAQHRPEEAMAEYETVLALDRNWVGAMFAIGWCKFYTGSIEEMIPLLEQIIRLSPRDPYIGSCYSRIGAGHLLQSRIDDAIVWLEKARTVIPFRPFPRICLAAAYGLKGKTGRAAAELAEAQRLGPDGRYSSIARLQEVGYFGVPKVRALFDATFFVGLRKAGMPEVERRAPQRRRNPLISAATWLSWPQLGAGDEIWDFLRATTAAALGAG
jgi:TolB-like protein